MLSLILFTFGWHNSSILNAQFVGSLLPYVLVSRLHVICRVQKSSVFRSYSKTTRFSTYDHISSQMVSSSNSLHIFPRKTRHTVDSYHNFFCTAEHKLHVICQVQKYFIFWSYSKTTRFSTYDHITSQMVSSSNSLHIFSLENSTYGRFLS
jgi:hypothetical protein